MSFTVGEVVDRAAIVERLKQLVDDGSLDDMGYGRPRWHKPWFRPAVFVSDRGSWAGAHRLVIEEMTNEDLVTLWGFVTRHLGHSERKRKELAKIAKDLCGRGCMKLVYTAGPFSAHTREAVEANIAAMERLGVEVAKLGAFPVIPHANTAHPDFEKVQGYQFWIDGTLELMRRCDAVLLSEDWKRSRGAIGERDEARRLGLPVFETLAQLEAWLGHREVSR